MYHVLQDHKDLQKHIGRVRAEGGGREGVVSPGWEVWTRCFDTALALVGIVIAAEELRKRHAERII